MEQTQSRTIYPLGNSAAELERLARQAQMLRRPTERAFRDAGIKPGDRVIDIGSGGGDITMLVADVVGADGEVVGIERSPEAIEHARKRVRDAHLKNISFVQADVTDYSVDRTFDAAVGRYILMFVPDAISVVRKASEHVRSGGAIVFIEPSWDMFFALAPDLPLWRDAIGIIKQLLLRCGGDPEMGLHLYRIFQSAGLPAPRVEAAAVLGAAESARWMRDSLSSNFPAIQMFGIPHKVLGDLDTLALRLESELREANSVAPIVPMIIASCTTR